MALFKKSWIKSPGYSKYNRGECALPKPLVFLILALAIIFASPCLLCAQDKVYLPFDLSKPANPPGGYAGANEYFKKNLPYPKQPGQVRGNRLVVAFVIEKDGTVQRPNMYVFETPGAAFTEAVLSCLESLKWNPAEANGNPVRYFTALMFFFHHPSGTVKWAETGVYMDNYEQLLAIPPEDYSKLEFYNSPKSMGIAPKDSVNNIQRYPEAARRADVQGLVAVDLLIRKDGQVGDISLKHDIGYGCGEEALRLARLHRNWVPAQIFDSVFEAHTQLLYMFCPHPERIDSSGKIYQDNELYWDRFDNLFNYQIGKFNKKYVPGTTDPPVKYNGSFVELAFTVTKEGRNENILIINSPGESYTRIVQDILQRETRSQGAQCCNIAVGVRLHRYASFIQSRDFRGALQNMVVFTRANPATTPNLLPPDDEEVYEASKVDEPAYYRVPGEKGVEFMLTLNWPDRKKEIPQGSSILLRVLIEKDGAVREAKVMSGINDVLDKKALQIVNTMGFWKPAYKNGHPARSWNVVRIR